LLIDRINIELINQSNSIDQLINIELINQSNLINQSIN